MKGLIALVMVVVAVFFAAPPVFAYSFNLDVWNTTDANGNAITDYITVDVNEAGNTVKFTFHGGGLTNTFQAMQNIGFQPDVFAAGDSITGVPSPYSLSCGTASGGGSCNEDGFSVNPAAAEYSTPNGGPGNPSSATFTFASALPAGLEKSDFDVHVTYSGGCSGWVDGALSGSPTQDSGCTPVPEPMTVFLGGTGLLIMGYFARKRLFSMGRILAA